MSVSQEVGSGLGPRKGFLKGGLLFTPQGRCAHLVWGRVGESCCDHLLGAFKLGNCLRPVFSFVCVCYSSHDEQSPHVCSGELASYIIYDFSIWSAE